MRRVFFILALAFSTAASTAQAAVPIVTDSRIKTFVYNENEVFTVTTHYGYQSNIEFGEKETIDTVSIGDRVAWQIIPAGRRLFIRAMEENAHTNMTIVTNKRAYQFDLRSSSADAVFGSEELTYVVRFYYPGESTTPMPMPTADITPAAPAATPISYEPVAIPATTSTLPAATLPSASALTTPAPIGRIPAASASNPAYNYRYTYSGNSNAAPVKIYDDGRSTYFKYATRTTPRVAVITTKGEQLAVPVRSLDGNIIAVDIVAPRFSLSQPAGQVIVYNESNGA